MSEILNELTHIDQILATIPVSQDAVFAMAAARTKLNKIAVALKEKEANTDG